jgi:hypothetical protein
VTAVLREKHARFCHDCSLKAGFGGDTKAAFAQSSRLTSSYPVARFVRKYDNCHQFGRHLISFRQKKSSGERWQREARNQYFIGITSQRRLFSVAALRAHERWAQRDLSFHP